jgi:hypothetical protein
MKQVFLLSILLIASVQAKNYNFSLETNDHRIYRSVALDSLDSDSLYTDINGEVVAFALTEISRVIIVRESVALRGIGIGALLGFLLGHLEAESCKGEFSVRVGNDCISPVFALIGGIFGAIAGIDSEMDMTHLNKTEKKQKLARFVAHKPVDYRKKKPAGY